MKWLSGLIALAALAFPSVAAAHGDASHTHGFLSGLSHPLTGIDHLVAAAAVGVWAGVSGGRSRWLLPAAFVTAMGAGIFLGEDMASKGVETAIALSLIGFGLFLALDTRLDLRIAALLVGGAGLAHGAAHAVEGGAALPAFAAGALLMTALLHASGLALALTARTRITLPLRFAGAATALFGVGLVSGALSA